MESSDGDMYEVEIVTEVPPTAGPLEGDIDCIMAILLYSNATEFDVRSNPFVLTDIARVPGLPKGVIQTTIDEEMYRAVQRLEIPN